MANSATSNLSDSFKRASDNAYNLSLLNRISARDTSALSEFYDLHSGFLYTIIYYIIRDRQESEDMLQEVFMQIWDKIESYDDSLGSPLAWITRLTRNRAIDRLRSKSFKKRSNETDIEKFFDLSEDSEFSDPEKNADRDKLRTEVRGALKSLNDAQKELIEYAYFRGFTQSELAEHFGIPLGTVKTRMRAAMMTLREKLKHLLG